MTFEMYGPYLGLPTTPHTLPLPATQNVRSPIEPIARPNNIELIETITVTALGALCFSTIFYCTLEPKEDAARIGAVFGGAMACVAKTFTTYFNTRMYRLPTDAS